jgi:Carbohydrate family 9 binding domain-like
MNDCRSTSGHRKPAPGRTLLLCTALILLAGNGNALPLPAPLHTPAFEQYHCPYSATAPVIDGDLDEPAWDHAAWSADFVDIEGDLKPLPNWRTNVKMLWDNDHLYVAARLEEPHVWATLTERDAVIYHDNDFEVFIDPDGDNHLYYELEINALNTVWDLLLVRPYRDGAPAVNAWDIQGLQTGVKIDGTLNDPRDRDQGWTVEIAIPWEVLGQCANRPSPPEAGDIWRMNFSRVQWQTEVVDGQYTKKIDTETGRALAENNWVWSPQGLIAMHYPERWGEVMFTRSDTGSRFKDNLEHRSIRAANRLMPVYYAQQNWREAHGVYAGSLAMLASSTETVCAVPKGWRLEMESENDRFLARLTTPFGTMTIDELGRLVRTPLKGTP